MGFVDKVSEFFGKDDGVTLILARHDNARGQDISAYGAAYAYLTGKFLCDCADAPYPDHIFYSPVSRARHTAKMHQLAMKLNDICIPTMSYDAGFHEHASAKKMSESLDDALLYAKSQNMRTVEIVGHEPTVQKLLDRFSASSQFRYGGCAVLKAKSWDDLLEGKTTEIQYFKSSKDLAVEVLGEEQAALLDDLMCNGATDGKTQFNDLTGRSQKQIKKAYKWIDDKEAGKPTKEKYSPAEFLEILDAYKYWGANSLTALGIAPDEKGPFQTGIQQLLFGKDSYFNQKFLAEFHIRSEENMDDSNSTQPYPLFNAVAKMIAEKAGVADKLNEENEKAAEQMEDFPMYRDIMSAGESRRLINDEEVKETKATSYNITKSEQQEHDRIADIVKSMKTKLR